jgi:branched-chain amino acid transport system permease protein
MQNLVAVLISGLSTGSIYALIVLGLTLLVLVRRIVHFSYPYIVVMTMYLGWLVLDVTNGNVFISLPAFIIIGIILLVATEVLYRPLARKGAFLESMVLGQGLAIFLTDISSHFINHGNTVAFPANMAGGGIGIRLGLIYFTLGNIYALVGSIIIVFLLFFFLFRTNHGRALRAMAQNQDIATSFGLSFNRMGIIGFGIAGILAGLVAISSAMVMRSVNAALGDTLATKSLILMLFAGMGNLTGGLVCALGMGVVVAITQLYLPGQWNDTIIFGLLMVIILIRPNGVFGART